MRDSSSPQSSVSVGRASAEIIPFRRPPSPGRSTMPGEAEIERTENVFAFLRDLRAVETEVGEKIAAGRTAEAIFASGGLVALTVRAASLSPECVNRALNAGERIKAMIDASIGVDHVIERAESGGFFPLSIEEDPA